MLKITFLCFWDLRQENLYLIWRDKSIEIKLESVRSSKQRIIKFWGSAAKHVTILSIGQIKTGTFPSAVSYATQKQLWSRGLSNPCEYKRKTGILCQNSICWTINLISKVVGRPDQKPLKIKIPAKNFQHTRFFYKQR